MPKSKHRKTFNPVHSKAVLLAGAAMLLLFGTVYAPSVIADTYDDQIRALQLQNDAKKSALSALKLQAASYQDAIRQLQAQIAAVQAQIDANTARQRDILAKIDENERELARQRGILGENIRVMYVESQISTIEILATSKNLSHFVEREEARNAVKNKIQDTLTRITTLQEELKTQKLEVEQLLAEQQTQESQLSYNRAEQSRLLGLNKSQQSAYNKEVATNNAKIADLKEQQAIENARLFGSGGGVLGGGGYPWGYARCIHNGSLEGYCPNYDWAVNGSIYNWDTGGYGFRNCTDWVSWRVRSTGGYVPSGLGDAKSWDDRASGYGYTVSSTPRRGAAAVSNAGTYGHVMYVESVGGDGSILISDYNRGGTGLYNTALLERVSEGRYQNSTSGSISTLTFVYF